MNKLIDKFFEKDMVVRILSVLIAILIWFIVLDQDNPFEERTISVPLTSNVEVLEDNNLQIVGSTLPQLVDVKIKGRRQRINSVSANDFKVSLDLSDITESGIKTLRIQSPQYYGETDIMLMGVNPPSIKLRFEKVIGKQYPVSIEFDGSMPEGYTVVNLNVDPSNIILEEKEGVMARIKKVVATVSLKDLRVTKELVVRAAVFDHSDKPLSQFDGKMPQVIVNYDLARTLPIAATVKGEPKEGYYFKEIVLDDPDVEVIGSKDLLDSLSKVNANPVDITGKSETFAAELELTLPKGASRLGEGVIRAQVVIEPLASREILLNTSMISIYESDTSGAKEYRLPDETFLVTVKGRPEAVQGLKSNDIRCSVNVGNLEIGEHVVPVNIVLPAGVSLKEKSSVRVLIVGNSTPEPEPTGTSQP